MRNLKSWLAALLAIVMVLSLAACGKKEKPGDTQIDTSIADSSGSGDVSEPVGSSEGDTSGGDVSEPVDDRQEGERPDPGFVGPMVPVSGDGWRIVNQSSHLYKYKEEDKDVNAVSVVEIENNGSDTLYLDTASFKYFDENGIEMDEFHLVSMVPFFVKPGEKAYFIADGAVMENMNSVDTKYNFEPEIEISKAVVEPIRWEVSDMNMTDGGVLWDAGLTGKVKATSDDDSARIYVLLYDSSNTLIGYLSDTMYEVAGAGTELDFEAQGFFFKKAGGEYQYSDIDHYTVYAEPFQMNF